MIRGENFGTYVILTGLLVESLGGFLEMVIIEISSHKLLLQGMKLGMDDIEDILG